MAMTTTEKGSLTDQLRTARDEAMAMRGDVMGIATEMQRLLQLEMELAKAEVDEAKGHATKGTAFGAMAAILGLITSVFLFLAIMFALDTLLPIWAAALATTGIALLLTAIFGFMAKQQISSFSPVPRRAIRTMQEDIKWAKSQIRSSTT